jgi:DNA-binding transcriptional ArsR family regulator
MQTDPLSLTFAALADPTRRALVARLLEGERSITELASPFDMTLPAVSKHLRVLERAGLVVRRKDAQFRPCRLEIGPLADVVAWAERTQQTWRERYDRLDAYLAELQATPPRGRKPSPDKNDTPRNKNDTPRKKKETRR